MEITYKNNPEILNEFLDYLSNIRNYSDNTIKSYCKDLLCFFNFLKIYYNINTNVIDFDRSILLRISKKDVIAFLVYLNYDKDNTAITRQRKLSSIRLFYKWLISHSPDGNLRENPTKDIPSIKQIIRRPKYLTLEQSKKIINIFTIENSIYPIRNNTILTLFLNCGLRISELKNLNINDINFTNRYIRVIGKGKKERRIFINDGTLKQLQKYFCIRNKKVTTIDINAPLFLNHQNKRLGIEGISDICKKAFKLAGFEEYNYTAHTLRHTSATILYKYVKPDILILKEYLGHNSIKATEIYLHTDDNIKNAINKNPLANVA